MEKGNRKKQITKISILLVSILVIAFSVTYAFIDMTLTGTKKQVLTSGSLKLVLDEDENNLTISDALPLQDEVGMIGEAFTFRLINESSQYVDYDLKLIDITAAEANKLDPSYVKYGLTRGSNVIIDYVKDQEEFIIDHAQISKNTTIEYTLRLWIKDVDVEDGTVLTDKTLSYRLAIEAGQATGDHQSTIYDMIRLSSLGTAVNNNINYSDISSDTNGKGVYQRNEEGLTKPVYFYRGKVDNQVIFANSCWNIVRTTETDDVKLIYSGKPSASGSCDNTGSGLAISSGPWSLLNDDNAYVGYMYGLAGAATHDETHTNNNDSDIKKTIDAWYEENLKGTSYEQYLSDSIYCNDRTPIKDFSNFTYKDFTNHDEYTNKGFGTELTMYAGSEREGIAVGVTKPTYTCSREGDRLTQNSSNGTGTLKYPIGLLTADEAVYAGATGGIQGKPGVSNTEYYLYTGGQSFWTMTPHRYSNNIVIMYVVNTDGVIANEVSTSSTFIRPVITVKGNTTILEGLGTKEQPYILAEPISKVPVAYNDNGIFKEYYDSAYEKLGTMSLDEKIGQLIVANYNSSTANSAIEDYKVGGFTFYADDFKDKTTEQVQSMIDSLQKKTKISLLMAVDEEGGKVVRVSSNSNLVSEPFKSSKVLYETGGFPLIKEDTINKSSILKNLGLNLNFAPVVDISDSSSYIYERTIGYPVDITSEYAKTVVAASKNTGVSYSLKHFPGYGNNSDTHNSSSVDDRNFEELMKRDIVPFQTGIEAKAESVMVSHNIVSAVDKENPSSLSKPVHDLLFQNLKFTGISITDNLDMGATKDISEKYIKAILAGNHILLTTNYTEAHQEIKNNITNGVFSEEELNKLVFKILSWKYYKGLITE